MIAAIYAVTRLAALLVLLTPWSASAECAWVLWSRQAGGGTQEWEIKAAYADKSQCDAGGAGYYKKLLAAGWKEKDGVLQADVLGGITFFGAWCLPDTVDPRAPKASGR